MGMHMGAKNERRNKKIGQNEKYSGDAFNLF